MLKIFFGVVNLKLGFFDIDGTLISRNLCVSSSVPTAIEQLRANGNKAFISSGRTKVLVHDPLLKGIEFDGVISGCGSLIEYRGEVLFYRTVPANLAVPALDVFKKNKVLPILEGKDFIFFDEDNDLPVVPLRPDLKKNLSDKILPLKSNFGKWEFSKFSCLTAPNISNVADCVASLEKFFDFQIHNANVFEMVTKGINKGSAIKIICEKLGIDIADTFAVGDSINDLDMLKTAGTAIAMANAPDEVKAVADYVTNLAEDDGIANALKHFNLID